MANYLYNGVELPDVNTVWTDELKETLPHAVIVEATYNGEKYYMLALTDLAPTGFNNDDGSRSQISYLGTFIYAVCYFTTSETVATAAGITVNEWVLKDQGTDSYKYYVESFYPTVWTAADILTSDGTLYLAASDPVPVITPIRPTSLPLIVLGNRLKTLRLQPKPPTGVYDDTWPIEWNTLEVMNNPRFESVYVDGKVHPYVKISNLIPTVEQFETSRLLFVNAEGVSVLEYTKVDVYDAGFASEITFSHTDSFYPDIIVYCVLDKNAFEENTSIAVPETGTYIIKSWLDDFDGNGSIATEEPEPEPDAPTGVYDDTWPIEWNMANLSGNTILSVDSETSYVKISNLTPTDDELALTTFTETTADGVSTKKGLLVSGEGYVIFGENFSNIYAVSVFPDDESTTTIESGIYVQYDTADTNTYSLDLDTRTVFEVSQANASTYGATWSFPDYDYDDTTITLVKVTDVIMTVEQICASGENLIDPYGTKADIEEYDGYSLARWVRPKVVSVSDVNTASIGGVSPPETGTYLFVPLSEDTARYKLDLS